MKIRLHAALLLAAFCVTLFSGCASASALSRPLTAPEITIATDPLPRSAVPAPTGASEATLPPVATPAATGPTHAQPQYISKEEAKNIALTHAGLSAGDVTRLRTEFDYDDGRAEYEVDFHHGGYEYDYEIDAESGAIRNWDKDRED